MASADTGLDPITGWTDAELRADDVRAAAVLYGAATLEELKLVELTEHVNELNQQKLLGIGVGRASDILHDFWDKGYKRMPAKRRLAVFARVVGTPGAPDDVERNEEFAWLFEDLVAAIAGGEDVASAAAELHANLADRTDESTTAAAVELRATLAELAEVLSDVELRLVYANAADMWRLVERFNAQHGGGPDVERARTLATCGATILRALPELRDGAPPSDEVAAAATRWADAVAT